MMIPTTPQFQRARSALRTPIAILIGLPLLVLMTGAGTAWIGHLHLARFAVEQAGERLRDSANGLSRAARNLVTGVDPILDRWREAVRRVRQGDDGTRWEAVLGDLMTANPWITLLGFSDTDGEFRGGRRDPLHGIVLIRRSFADDQRVREWAFDGNGRPQLIHDELGEATDPRAMPLYQETLAASLRQWSSGISLIGNSEPKLIRAETFYGDDGAPLGIISLDLSLDRLRLRMQAAASDIGASMVLLDAKGGLLFDTDDRRPAREQHVAAFELALTKPLGLVEIVDGDRGRALVHCQDMQLDDELHVKLGMIAPLQPLLAEANNHLRDGLWLTALFILIAAGVAALYTRMVILAREAIAAAQQVADRMGAYVLERQVGSGGMGEVWQARHRRLAFPAALKLIRRDALGQRDPQRARARFVREAQAMARLTSPNTVRVFDYGELDDGTLYYAMELIDGLNLETLVERRGALSPGAVVAILLAVCDSLAEAHRHGLVHRDIKPSNMLVCRAGDRVDVIKVIDFGLVVDNAHEDKQGPRLTQEGFVAGTPGFASPEQMRGETLDGRSDLYSLGCVAFWLLSKRQVFPSASIVEEMRRHLEEPAPSVQRVSAMQVPVGLDEIIHALLAKKPDDRPKNAADLRARLLLCGVRADGTALGLHAGEGLAELASVAVEQAVVVRPRAARSEIAGG